MKVIFLKGVKSGKVKEKETKIVVSQIPQMFLDNSVNECMGNVEPFFLSILVNGKTLKNCMIDSGASSTVMPFEIMRKLGLKVDTTQGRCCAMDKRPVTVIGTINALPYRLTACPDRELTMSVLVVDIPPQYGMLLSRKWSAAMGGSLQCDLSFATFNIDGNLVKIDREPKSVYMIIEDAEDDMTNFVDTDVNTFRAELMTLKRDKQKTPMEEEVKSKSNKGDLWAMFFDGAYCKDGAGAGILLISPAGVTYKFSFTLSFPCTNNIAEYEALLLGLKIAHKHGIKCLHVIGDSELVISQIRNAYVSKNKRLKQYRNAVWDMIECFDAFGIIWKDRSNNKMADLLANIAVKPDDITFAGISKIETQIRPSIPDNVQNWQVFEDDKDILRFLNCENMLSGQEIDCAAYVENIGGKDTIFGKEVVQLKTNKIPKGLVALETIFDNQDRAQVDTSKYDANNLEEVNLGTRETPKKVYIGKKLSSKIR